MFIHFVLWLKGLKQLDLNVRLVNVVARNKSVIAMFTGNLIGLNSMKIRKIKQREYKLVHRLMEEINFTLRTFYSYFDADKCQWKLENQDNCLSVTETIPKTTTTIATTTHNITTAIQTAFTTSTTTASTTGMTSKIVPAKSTCDALDSNWMCSMENNQHSLCIKFCSINDVTSYKRCTCKQSSGCLWFQKGPVCLEDTSDPISGNIFPTHDFDSASLSSILKEINIANNGHIHFKFML